MRFPPEFDLHTLEAFVLAVELGGMSQSANIADTHRQKLSGETCRSFIKLGDGNWSSRHWQTRLAGPSLVTPQTACPIQVKNR